MSIRNNVNLDALQTFSEAIQKDPSKGKRTNKVEGTWNLEAGKPQFSAEISYGQGKLTLETDQPSFSGGGGTRPGPMHYCLFGMASCYTATFATIAAMEGIELKALKVTVESDVNFAKTLGISDAPIIEEVRIALQVESEAGKEKIDEIAKLAEERCPGVYCMTHPVPLKTQVTQL